MTTPTLRDQLTALIAECENANKKWLSQVGVGAVCVKAISDARAALAAQPELPQFQDPIVQVVYEILIAYEEPPENEHWEGFVARKIAAQLQQAAEQASSNISPEALIGLSVSVDVSTGDADSGNRLFGTVYEVQQDELSKGGITLLVADVEPNFQQAKWEPMTDRELANALELGGVGTQWTIGITGKRHWTTRGSIDPRTIARAIEAHYNIGDKV